MNFQAYVYGWRHIVTGKMYIGFRKNSEENDGYIFSSEDEELRKAWSLGLLHRTILFRGTVSESITMERKLLKHADARRNSKFYNKSNGGGAEIGDYTKITDDEAKVGIDWINGIEPVEIRDAYDFVDTDMIEQLWLDVQAASISPETSKYKILETSIEEILKYKQNQVRLLMLDHKHMHEISEYMQNDSAEARKHVSPIIVSVSADGTRTIIDGNHTSRAAHKAGWVTAPVIFINSSQFKDNQSNIDHFGIIANHNPKQKKGNKPEDCQRNIINLYNNNLKALDDDKFTLMKSEKFKETCLKTYKLKWTKKMIVQNLERAIQRVRTDHAIASLNFQLYSKNDLDKISNPIEKANPKLAVITVTSGSVYNSGLGGILNKMGGLDTWSGVIIVHHSSLEEYETWKSSENKLKSAMKRVHPDCKIKYVVLNSFKKQTKVKV
jgi:hypothetical protein